MSDYATYPAEIERLKAENASLLESLRAARTCIEFDPPSDAAQIIARLRLIVENHNKQCGDFVTARNSAWRRLVEMGKAKKAAEQRAEAAEKERQAATKAMLAATCGPAERAEWESLVTDARNRAIAAEKRSADLTGALTELLRLYDWRFVLAERERDPRGWPDSVGFRTPEALEFWKETRRLLMQYGTEKKAAWEAARAALHDEERSAPLEVKETTSGALRAAKERVEAWLAWRNEVYKLLVDGYGPGGGFYTEDQRLGAAVALLQVGWGARAPADSRAEPRAAAPESLSGSRAAAQGEREVTPEERARLAVPCFGPPHCTGNDHDYECDRRDPERFNRAVEQISAALRERDAAHEVALKKAREGALREAARLAEDWGWSNKPDYALGIATAIRVLLEEAGK